MLTVPCGKGEQYNFCIRIIGDNDALLANFRQLKFVGQLADLESALAHFLPSFGLRYFSLSQFSCEKRMIETSKEVLRSFIWEIGQFGASSNSTLVKTVGKNQLVSQ